MIGAAAVSLLSRSMLSSLSPLILLIACLSVYPWANNASKRRRAWIGIIGRRGDVRFVSWSIMVDGRSPRPRWQKWREEKLELAKMAGKDTGEKAGRKYDDSILATTMKTRKEGAEESTTTIDRTTNPAIRHALPTACNNSFHHCFAIVSCSIPFIGTRSGSNVVSLAQSSSQPSPIPTVVDIILFDAIYCTTISSQFFHSGCSSSNIIGERRRRIRSSFCGQL